MRDIFAAIRQPAHTRRRITGRTGTLIMATCLLGAGVAAWFIYNRQNGAPPGTTGQQVNATCAYSNQELCNFFATWSKQQTYTVTSTNQAGGTTTSTILRASGNNYYLKREGKTPYEMVVIGDTMYTRANGSDWWKQKISAADSKKYRAEGDIALANPQTSTAAGAYKNMGTEACGDLTCYKEQYTPSAGTTDYIWFDTKDYKLRRVQIQNSGGTSESTISYSTTAVTAPTTAQTVAANQQITPGESAPSDLPSTGDAPPTPEQWKLYKQMYPNGQLN